ncbi:MAG: hypothetical protein U0P81_02355 [Holophagaceae bacterium]
MAVEIHFITALVRKDAVARLHREDAALVQKALRWEAGLFREDEHLLATEFASGQEAAAFVADLEEAGVLWLEAGPDGAQVARDAVLVDQRTGPTLPCPWLELAEVEGLPAAHLRGRPAGSLVQAPWFLADPAQRGG